MSVLVGAFLGHCESFVKVVDSSIIFSHFTANDRFWMPDVFIDQAKALRTPTFYTKPASLRVYNDSTIRYSSRCTWGREVIEFTNCDDDIHR